MKLASLYRRLIGGKPVFSSRQYWETRYNAGGNSGRGSYAELSQFKAKVVNDLINKYAVADAIEFGVGDGNQLQFINYPKYLGLDVSGKAIELCASRYAADPSKSFLYYDQKYYFDPAGFLKADMSLSLDVIYHLVEQEVYEQYLKNVFNAGRKVVVIYSTNQELPQFGYHEKHREFLKDVERLITGWKLSEMIDNEYSVEKVGEEKGSRANFYIFLPSR